MNDRTMHTLSGSSQFPSTRWTVVVAAGDPHRKEARSALVALCENYWYPLYAYLRRRGYAADQAQDLTQDFFIRILEGRYLDRADPEKSQLSVAKLAARMHIRAILLAPEDRRVPPSRPEVREPRTRE
jgi:DNA-directed RNA polymerase specialized sigma24 family protein